MKTLSRFLLAILVIFGISAGALAAGDGLFDQAVEAYQKGRYEEVVRLLDAYTAETPDPAAYYVMGYALYALGRHDEATRSFQDAFLVDPEFEPQSVEGLYGPPGAWTPPAREPGTKLHLLQGTVTLPEGTEKVVMEPPPRPSESAAATTSAPEPATRGPPPREPGTASPSAQAAPETAVVRTPEAKEPEAPPEKAPKPPVTPPPAPPKAAPAPRPAPPMPSSPQDLEEMMKQMPGGAQAGGVLMGLLAGFMVAILIAAAVLYLVYALCLFLIAKKLEVPKPWIAWIPIAQAWTFVAAAGKPATWLLVLFSPILGTLAGFASPAAGAVVGLVTGIVSMVTGIYLWMCITENLGLNKFLGLLTLVPAVNVIFVCYLAFSKSAVPSGGGGIDTDFSFDETEADELFDEEASS